MLKAAKLSILLMLVVFTTQNYCGEYQQYDHNLRKCVCIYDSLEIGGCSPCPQKSYYDHQSKSCQCNHGYSLEETSKQCLPICGQNQALNADGVCECAPWYSPTSMGCQLCPEDSYYNFHECFCRAKGYVWDQQFNKCVLKCDGWNEIIIGKQCFCHEGTHRVKGICQFCPFDSFWVAQTRQCPCRQNYELDVDSNKCIKKCGQNQSRNKEGVCVCDYGFIAKQYEICEPICGVNEKWNGEKCEHQCQANSAYNEESKLCICNQGYAMNAKQICELVCLEDQIYADGECKCIKAGAYKQNGECKYCPVDQSYSDGQCRCTSIGHYMIDGVCQYCPDFSTYVQYAKQCVCFGGYEKINGECSPSCPIGEIYKDGKCQCPENMFRLRGVCDICPQNSILKDELTCECAESSYKWNWETNTCDKFCPVNEQLLYGGCVCAEGFSRNDQGVCIPICSEEYYWSEGKCKCKNGLNRILSYCVECPIYSVYQEHTEECICIGGTILDQQGNCVSLCVENQVWVNSECICLNGFHLINGKCTFCPEKTVFDKQIGECVCIEGTAKDQQGKCVSVCGENQVWFDSQCICLNGFHLINGKCTACPYNTVFNEKIAECVCIEGTKLSQKGECQSICAINQVYSEGHCKCTQWLFKINGVCSSCPKFTQYSQTTQTCECIAGFQKKENSEECEKVCPKWLVSIDGECRCSEGLFLIKGQCRSCQPYSTYVSSEQHCVCQAGFLERQAGVCTPRCKDYEVWHNNECICTNPYYKIDGVCGVCPENSYFWGDKCICYYSLVLDKAANKCVNACSDQQNFVNGVCQCISGMTRHFGKECVHCPATSYYNGPADKCECFHQTMWNEQKTECITPCPGRYLTADGKCV